MRTCGGWWTDTSTSTVSRRCQRLHLEIELDRNDVKLVVLPPPCPQHVQPIDFSHADELIARALHDSRAFLAQLADGTGTPDATAPAERLLPTATREQRPAFAANLPDADGSDQA